ncbi:MAG: type II secretion system protein M [Desulfobacter sp.]|nr:MAG: type II secretion system protein M [Desulfobacter sp.]
MGSLTDNFSERLSSREKQIVLGGGILAVLFVCIQFIYLPAYDKNIALGRTLAAEQAALERIGILEREYRDMAPDNREAAALIKNRKKGFTLFSFLDRQASQSGVKEHIDYMKPNSRELDNQPFSLAVVKLKLKKIVLRDFIRFVGKVESPENGIRIVSLSLTKSGKTGNLLDATIEAQTIMAKGGGA